MLADPASNAAMTADFKVFIDMVFSLLVLVVWLLNKAEQARQKQADAGDIGDDEDHQKLHRQKRQDNEIRRLSSKVGNVDYSEAHEGYRGNTGGFSISAKTKEAIEDEVKRIIDEGYELAYKTISENSVEFDRVAQGLLEYETLTGEEIRKVMAGEKLGSGDDAGTPPAPSGGGSASVVAIPKTRKPRTTKPKPDPEPSPL